MARALSANQARIDFHVMRNLMRPRRPIVLSGNFRILFIALMSIVLWHQIRGRTLLNGVADKRMKRHRSMSGLARRRR